MRVVRDRVGDLVAIRAELAATYRALAADHGVRLGLAADRCPFALKARALEAGESVRVAAWEVPESLRPPDAADNYLLTAEGGLVSWEPAQ
jgi:hypothetical protein